MEADGGGINGGGFWIERPETLHFALLDQNMANCKKKKKIPRDSEREVYKVRQSFRLNN